MAEKLGKGIDWPKWVGLIIALGALVYAHLAYQHSESVLEFQKQEASRRRASIVKLQPFWALEKVYFSGFQKTHLFLGVTKGEEKFFGLDFFVKLKIFNESEHAISVDGLLAFFIYKNWLSSQLSSNMCFEDDLETRVKFPISIEPYAQRRVLIRIPIPIDERLKKMLDHLEPDSLYSSKDIVLAYWEIVKSRPLGLDYPGIL